MSRKRKFLEGLSAFPGENEYPQPALQNQQITIKEQGLVSGSDINKDQILVITIKLGPEEYGRYASFYEKND
jgi:hypothetical protein